MHPVFAYTLYGNMSTNVVIQNSSTGFEENICVLNSFIIDWVRLVPTEIIYCDNDTIQDNINKLDNNPNYIVVSNPHSNEIKCNDINDDCMIFVNQAYNLDQQYIYCQNYSKTCSVILYVYVRTSNIFHKYVLKILHFIVVEEWPMQ